MTRSGSGGSHYAVTLDSRVACGGSNAHKILAPAGAMLYSGQQLYLFSWSVLGA
jgi:hypothetical protein